MTPGEKQLELTAILENLNDDERNVVLDVALRSARRMHMGRIQYGPLDLSTDARDWDDEADAECDDLSNYRAMRRIIRAKR
jgi:hypothetical protein